MCCVSRGGCYSTFKRCLRCFCWDGCAVLWVSPSSLVVSVDFQSPLAAVSCCCLPLPLARPLARPSVEQVHELEAEMDSLNKPHSQFSQVRGSRILVDVREGATAVYFCRPRPPLPIGVLVVVATSEAPLTLGSGCAWKQPKSCCNFVCQGVGSAFYEQPEEYIVWTCAARPPLELIKTLFSC